MLIRFSTANHLSFKERVNLDFSAGGIKEYKEQNVYNLRAENYEFGVLKSVGIFGENASGKSNLMKSFAFMQNFLLNSSTQSLESKSIAVQPFRLNKSTESEPSLFEVIIYASERFFRYGFEVTPNAVIKEWLFVTEKKQEEALFIRSNLDFQIGKKFRGEAQGEILSKVTRHNTLFLSVLAQFNSSIAQSIASWFNNAEVIFDFTTVKISRQLREMLHNDSYKAQLHKIIESFPFGFTSIEDELKDVGKGKPEDENFRKSIYEEDIKNFVIKTKHKKFDANNKHIGYEYFDLATNESAGTIRFLGLLNPFLTALHEKKVLFIDELDAHLHPNILVMLIQLFNSSINNPNGAQLVFTSQNTKPLAKKFRRDQMIMMEKDEYGISQNFSLHTGHPKRKGEQSVRNDASFEKDYLEGVYVKVPLPFKQMNLFE